MVAQMKCLITGNKFEKVPEETKNSLVEIISLIGKISNWKTLLKN